jgi:hypothetical protein
VGLALCGDRGASGLSAATHPSHSLAQVEADDGAAAVDRAFREFFAAPDQNTAARRVDAILKTRVTFEDALARVRQGREYSVRVPRGLQRGRHRTFDTIMHEYTFVVPESYDPQRQYQVRVQLHGGAGRPRPPVDQRLGIGRLPGVVEEITIYPAAWAQALWWSATQVDNVIRIVDKVKRTYNVDENLVYVTGSSDGGTGAYFMAFKDTTPWASFLPLIGDMTVLAAPQVRADGEIFPGNAANKPFFVVNAGRDRLYPAHVVRFSVEHLRRLGAEVVFRVQPDSDHATAWWPEERIAFEEFVHDHARDPLPAKLSWETERTDRFNRAHWLIIDRLGDVSGQSDLPDSNLVDRGLVHDFGLRINSTVDRGRRASEVVPNSNAQRIGLQTDDRFIEVGGNPVQTGHDIAEAIERFEIGGAVRFIVERDGRRVVLEGRFEPDEVHLPPIPIFPRKKASGRVDLVRRGNVVEASTEGVRAFTLLLSPSVFNFRQPIRVVANGRTVHDAIVEPKVETLLKWAARDNDRTMVFGAELQIELAE